MSRIAIESIAKEEYTYLWYPYVPFGVPSIFQGQAGYGKTTLLCKIMAELSHGIYPPRLVRGTIKGRRINTSLLLPIKSLIDTTVCPPRGNLNQAVTEGRSARTRFARANSICS